MDLPLAAGRGVEKVGTGRRPGPPGPA